MNRILIAAAVSLASIEALSAAAEWLWPVSLGGATHWRGSPKENGVSLTFDDGPSAYTGAVLDILRAERAPATFFVIGSQVERYPTLVRRMAAEGHEIGNHTYSFVTRPVPLRLFYPVSASQVAQAQDVVRGVVGTTPRYFRSPGGQMGRPLWNAVRQQRLGVVNGTIPIPHPECAAPEQLATVLRTVRGGAIIILHDGDDRHPDSGRPRATVELLPRLVPALRERGFAVVPLSRLLRVR